MCTWEIEHVNLCTLVRTHLPKNRKRGITKYGGGAVPYERLNEETTPDKDDERHKFLCDFPHTIEEGPLNFKEGEGTNSPSPS